MTLQVLKDPKMIGFDRFGTQSSGTQALRVLRK